MPSIRATFIGRSAIVGIVACFLAALTNDFAQESSPPAETKATKPLRILILGGTGFTGPFQVRYALARGHKVTVFNRGKTHPGELPEGVEQFIGDRNGQLDALKDRKWDVVIDNPTIGSGLGARRRRRSCKGNVDRYVFISTISVYADTANRASTKTRR